MSRGIKNVTNKHINPQLENSHKLDRICNRPKRTHLIKKKAEKIVKVATQRTPQAFLGSREHPIKWTQKLYGLPNYPEKYSKSS